jgi:endonuclease/exonuclease/phosphatase family metal-dependent hydrolase
VIIIMQYDPWRGVGITMMLKVVSSNIRFANKSDGEHNWPHRQPVLAEVINQFAPDLLGTQEGKKNQIYQLATALPNLKIVDQHREWISERMYPSIFINPNTIKVVASGDIWLSTTPHVPGSISFNSAFPRLCTWIKARQIKTDKQLFYINVHLDHHYEETRKEQISVLLSESKKINQERAPIILSGDFNDPPQQTVWTKITQQDSGPYDPWIHLNHPEESSHHRFTGSNPSGARIDWIMVDQRVKTVSMELDKSCNSNGIYPSDHFPLKAVFKL